MSEKPKTTAEAMENLRRAVEQMRVEFAEVATETSRKMAELVKATRR